MAQYIDKDALVAEIERRKNLHFKIYAEEGFESSEGKYVEDKHILSFINTLKVKEVDLEEEIDNYFNNSVRKNILANDNATLFMQCRKVAKHFFELGLRAQKGE